MKDEEYFPFEAGRQSYEYLQQLVREKTETIDLITANIAGGLKVSEDGEPYRLVYVNEGLARMLGYTTEEFMSMSGGTVSGIVHPPDLDQALADVRRCFAQGSSYETEYRVRKKNGELAWIMDSGRKMKAVDGSVKISSLLMDITSRKRAEQALLLEQERYRIALRSVTDVLFEYDVEQDALIEFERGAATADGAPPEERRYPRYTASAESGRIHPDDFRRLSEALRDDGSTTMEVRHRVAGSGDAWRWVRMHARMLRDAEGRPVRTIGSWKDVTEERRRIEQLVDQARRDPLTKLLNQGAAAELVAQQLPACAERGTGALLVADIDDFKAVNDTYGHLAGDDLLVGAAGVLAEGLRSEEGFAARIGGDEFVAVPAARRRGPCAQGRRAPRPGGVGAAGVGPAGHAQRGRGAGGRGRRRLRASLRRRRPGALRRQARGQGLHPLRRRPPPVKAGRSASEDVQFAPEVLSVVRQPREDSARTNTFVRGVIGEAHETAGVHDLLEHGAVLLLDGHVHVLVADPGGEIDYEVGGVEGGAATRGALLFEAVEHARFLAGALGGIRDGIGGLHPSDYAGDQAEREHDKDDAERLEVIVRAAVLPSVPPVPHQHGEGDQHGDACGDRRAAERGEGAEGDEPRAHVAHEVERDNARLACCLAPQRAPALFGAGTGAPGVAQDHRHEADHARAHGHEAEGPDAVVDHALEPDRRREFPVHEHGEPAEQQRDPGYDEGLPPPCEIGAQKAHAVPSPSENELPL